MILLYLTQKIRIFPTPAQEQVLWELSENCRLIYNFALKERIDAWRNNGESIKYTKQQNDLPQLKQKYPRYKSNYSKTLQATLKKLDQDYKSFFSLRRKGDKNARPPRYKGKKRFTTIVYNQSGFKITNTLFGQFIEFSHSYNSTPLEFKIPSKFRFGKIKEVQIFVDKGDYYISITHEVNTPEYKDNGLYQAIDLGVSKIVTAVNTEGKFLEVTNLRPDKYWMPIINKLKSRRDHCKKGSRRWKKLNKLVQKCFKKMRDQTRDFQHKLSNKLVNNTRANTIIVGDLDVKLMAQNKNNNKAQKSLNYSTQNTGTLSRFVGFLTYKAQRIGKRVIAI